MIQASPAQAPTPPLPPAIPGGTIVSSRVLNNSPMSAQEVAALRARREVLSDQLRSADGRRRELSRLVKNATGADKAGLEQRIGVLDARLARLENDIDETGKLLASAPAALASTREPQTFNFGPASQNKMQDVTPIVAIIAVFAIFPIALSIARNIWRRGSRPAPAELDRESALRLERMEQAMDAIAVEIERVSEGQRFVTRLLGEQRVAQPVAEPVALPPSERSRL
ncbi:MAG TPA: hypothetical protein VFN38_07205 [Gemmatimonadaceae bacterium]|nr:hypothetical protein [Gemmatimonadaceae bacterium]